MGMHIPEMQAHPIAVTVTGIGLAVDQYFFYFTFQGCMRFFNNLLDFWVGIIMTSCFLHF
jgi:hypothetical protein